MDKDIELVAIGAEISAINARIVAYAAENAHRSACGNGVAYDAEAFLDCETRLKALAERARALQTSEPIETNPTGEHS